MCDFLKNKKRYVLTNKTHHNKRRCASDSYSYRSPRSEVLIICKQRSIVANSPPSSHAVADNLAISSAIINTLSRPDGQYYALPDAGSGGRILGAVRWKAGSGDNPRARYSQRLQATMAANTTCQGCALSKRDEERYRRTLKLNLPRIFGLRSFPSKQSSVGLSVCLV